MESRHRPRFDADTLRLSTPEEDGISPRRPGRALSSLQEEKTMPPIMRTLLSLDRARHDPRDGDPYLEALVRQLVLLGGGDSIRRRSARRRG
jgi:hypothetical protein